jgi:hypothetical protein
MLNTLISLGLESVGRQAYQASRSLATPKSGAGLGSYPVLRSALLRAEKRGSLEIERQKMMVRLGSN